MPCFYLSTFSNNLSRYEYFKLGRPYLYHLPYDPKKPDTHEAFSGLYFIDLSF